MKARGEGEKIEKEKDPLTYSISHQPVFHPIFSLTIKYPHIYNTSRKYHNSILFERKYEKYFKTF